MAYRGITDPFTPKCTRNERFKQMSQQEQLIEQKKREIQIKLEEQKKKGANDPFKKLQTSTVNTKSIPVNLAVNKPAGDTSPPKNARKPFWKSRDRRRKKDAQQSEDQGHTQPSNSINIFSNDGSFLDQFKKLSGVKKEIKSKREDDASVANNDSNSCVASNSESDQKQDSGLQGPEEEERDLGPNDKDQTNAAGTKEREREALQNSDNGSQARHSVEDHGSWQGQGSSSPVASGRPSSPYSPTRATDTPSALVVSTQPQYRPQPQLIQPPPSISMTTPPPPILTQQPVQPFISYTAPPPPILNLPPPGPVPIPSLSSPSPVPGPSLCPPGTRTTPSIPPPTALGAPSLPPPSPLQASSVPHPQSAVCPAASMSLLHPSTILSHAVSSGLSGNNSALPTQLLHPPPIIQQHSIPASSILAAQSIGSTTLTHTVPSLSAITVSAPVLQPGLSLPLISGPVVPSLLGHHIPPPSISLSAPVPATSRLAALTGTGVSPAAPVGESPGDETTIHLARMVAQCGDDIEEIIKVRNPDDQALWFLHDKTSTAYIQFRCLVDKFRSEIETEEGSGSAKVKEENIKLESSDIGERNISHQEHRSDRMDERKVKREIKSDMEDENSRHSEGKRSGDESDESATRRRKRRSRWAPESDKVDVTTAAVVAGIVPAVEQVAVVPAPVAPQMLSRVVRTDPALIQYAVQAFGTQNLSEEDWKKAEDHYKINLLYQDMIRKRQEIERLQRAGRFKYEYDSDEETDGGTWEHHLRSEEMRATQLWAEELTKKAEGKHHIGDFLPPDELERFMEKYSALKEGREPDLSDYKEFKLKEDNIGFQMLQKLGWSEGQGLGSEGLGITEPVNKASTRPENQGLGLERPDDVSKGDDEYDAYRKRMMLAYRFRPNPLNNPRRPYY